MPYYILIHTHRHGENRHVFFSSLPIEKLPKPETLYDMMPGAVDDFEPEEGEDLEVELAGTVLNLDEALPSTTMLGRLRAQFPWLGSNQHAPGADVVDEVNDLYRALMEEAESELQQTLLKDA